MYCASGQRGYGEGARGGREKRGAQSRPCYVGLFCGVGTTFTARVLPTGGYFSFQKALGVNSSKLQRQVQFIYPAFNYAIDSI